MRSEFQVGPWLVQSSLNTISSAGASKRLEPKVMQVLVELAGRAGQVVAKDELMRLVWPDTFVGDEVLTRCVSELRRALEDDAKEPRFIQTISKKGYRLVAAVSEVVHDAPPQAQETPAAPARPRRWGMVAGSALTVAALVAGYLIWRVYWPPFPSPHSRMMLAVLPFQNLSGDPGQEYFSDGLTEEMITQLARLQPENLGVIARTSAMQYKSTKKNIQQVGRELRVDYIVEGSVRREGERARITVQLIRVSDQSHLWADSFDRELSGMLSVQTEVARAVSDRIRLALGSRKSAELAASRPVQPDAYIAYLMGNYLRHRLTPEDMENAIGHFRRAIELDANFAPAWLGLADCHRLLGSWWGDLLPEKAFPQAEQALERALKLDATLGEARASLGWIYFVYHWDWRKAEEEFKRGVELSPNARDALSPYANFLRRMTRLEEARRLIDRCVEIDPLSPLEVTEAARVLVALGEPEKAEALFLRMSETAPDSRPTLLGLGQYHLQAKQLDKAIEYLERASRTTRRDRLALPSLGIAYAQAGRTAEARAVLSTLLKTPEIAQGAIAELYASLGEKEEALGWWRKAYEGRDSRMVWLRLFTASHPLWGDARFQQLLRLMDFPK